MAEDSIHSSRGASLSPRPGCLPATQAALSPRGRPGWKAEKSDWLMKQPGRGLVAAEVKTHGWASLLVSMRVLTPMTMEK